MSGRGAGSGRGDDWTEAARRAYLRAESGRDQASIKLKCPGNLLLYLFLIELRLDMEARDPERYKNALFNINRAKGDVLSHAWRLCSRQHLVGLSGVKDMLANIIERNLWSLYPPEEEDEEEQQLRAQAQRAADAARKAEAAAKKQQQRAQQQQQQPHPAAAAHAQPGSQQACGVDPGAAFRQPGVAGHDPLAELARILRRDPKAAALHAKVQRQAAAAAAAAAAGGSGAAAAAARPPSAGTAPAAAAAAPAPKKRGGSGGRKRTAAAAAVESEDIGSQPAADNAVAAAAGGAAAAPKRARAPKAAKEYMPRAGTANYAFMITLYLGHRTGTPHMSKEGLIAAAEASKLADTPIQGNTNAWAQARGPGKWYDGWSNIKTLENRDVPLIQRWSNPLKVRLTAAGMALGATLYRHAVESGKMQPHAQVPHDEDPPPGSPTAAAGPGSRGAAAAAAAGMSGQGAAAAAAAEAATAPPAAKKPRKTKAAAAQVPHAAAAAAAAAAGSSAGLGSGDPLQPGSGGVGGSSGSSHRSGSGGAAAGGPPSQGSGAVQISAAVAAAVAAANAAAAAAAALGVGRPASGSAAAAAPPRRSSGGGIFAGDPDWGADDPCLAGDGLWSAQDRETYEISDSDDEAAAAIAAAAAAGAEDVDYDPVEQEYEMPAAAKVSRKRHRTRTAAAAAGTGGVRDEIYDEADNDGDGWEDYALFGDGGAAATAGGAAAAAAAVDAADVAALVGMGFDESAAEQALRESSGCLEEAITWLTEVAPSQQQQQQQESSQQPSEQQQQSQDRNAGDKQPAPPFGGGLQCDDGAGDEALQAADDHDDDAAAAGAVTPGECVQWYFDDVVDAFHKHLTSSSSSQHQQSYQQQQQQQQFERQGTAQDLPRAKQQAQQQQQGQTLGRPPDPYQSAAAAGPADQGRPPLPKARAAAATAAADNPAAAAAAAAARLQQQHVAPSQQRAWQRQQQSYSDPDFDPSAAAAAAAAAKPARSGSGRQAGSSGGSRPPPPPAAVSSSTYVGLDMSAARPWAAPLLPSQLQLRLPPLGPGQSFGQVYDVVLLIDQREQYGRTQAGARTLGRTEALTRYAAGVAAQGVRVDSTVTLACGDVLWVAQHRATKARYVLDFLAERKSYEDLAASIVDGRYSAQKWFMAGDAGLANCLYILEGSPADLIQYGTAVSSKAAACVTAMHRTLLHDGFKVLETAVPAESVDLLARITKFLVGLYGPRTAADSPAPAAGSSSGGGSSVELLEAWNARITTARRTKTVRQKWQELLLSVSGIGVEAVQAVVAAYPTPISLYRAYKAAITAALAAGSNASAAAKCLLCELPQASGQRLGPARSRIVYDRLFMNGWDLTGQQQ